MRCIEAWHINMNRNVLNWIIIIYRPGARGFGEILPEVMITEDNISPNPSSGGSINDILYRKLKASKLRMKNLTHVTYCTFVNTMFYFRINASIALFFRITYRLEY